MTPNDPSYSSLWGMAKIQAPTAWNLSTGTGVVVAVVDTGIDASHPDLAANIWTNPDEVPGNGIDDDGNGYVDDVHGWDCVSEDTLPSDGHGHGSHVAGTIAATGNNGIGVIGLAFKAKLIPVKGLNDLGQGTSADLAQALVYAADNGADVINNSWGGTGTDPVIENAVAYAVNLGAVVVAAAGNTPADVSTFYPARYPGVLAVSAFDSNDQIASFSNYGLRIDVAAPGVGILSTYKDAYSTLSGTSMASPHVAGLAALILSQHPEYSASQVRQVIRQSADDVAAPGFDIQSGYGRINAAKAMITLPVPADTTPPQISIVSPANNAFLSGSTVVSGTASDNGTLYQINIFLDGVLRGTAAGLASWSYSLDLQFLTGTHTLMARASDIEGNSASASIQFTVVNSGNAAYDPVLKVPACGLPGASCDTGNLILGRDTMVTETSARISWTTDELADGQVEYGPTPALGFLSPLQPVLITSHTVDLTGLLPATSYSFRVRSNDAAGNGAVSEVSVFATKDPVPPTVSIANPLEGAVLSGNTVLAGSAEDNVGLAHVTLFIDGRKWKTVLGVGPAAVASRERSPDPEVPAVGPLSVSSSWSFSLDTTQLDNAPHVLRVDAEDAAGNVASATRSFVAANGAAIAVYHPNLGAPSCDLPGAVCASGGRLEGRDTIAGGFPEPNQPNTLTVNPCADGASGIYHADESLDWLRVTSVDGSPTRSGPPFR